MPRTFRLVAATTLALSAFSVQADEPFQTLNNHVRLFGGANTYGQLSESYSSDYLSKDRGTLGTVNGAVRLQGDIGGVNGVFGELTAFSAKGDSRYAFNSTLTGQSGSYDDVPASHKGWHLKVGKKLPLGGDREQFVAYAVFGKQAWTRDASNTASARRTKVAHDFIGGGLLTQIRLTKAWSVELDVAAAQTRNIRMTNNGVPMTLASYRPHTQTMLSAAVVQEMGKGWAVRYALDYTHARFGEDEAFVIDGMQYVLPRAHVKGVSYGVGLSKAF